MQLNSAMTDSHSPLVDLVLATFNGARFLRDLLDSLLAQSYQRWRLVVRDDGSSDGTVELLESFREAHPDRMVIVRDGRGNLGAQGNFAAIASLTSGDYLMFADQDDTWYPKKIEITLNEMFAIERAKGADVPVLVHTDMNVVDIAGNVIAESFWEYQNLNADTGMKLPRQLVQNYVTGCAMMINRKLLNLAMPIPPNAIMHDWWFALVASAFGEIAAVDEPTLKYRQHGGNSIGAKRWGYQHVAAQLLGGIKGLRRRIEATQDQAKSFVERYEPRLSPELARAARDYSELGRHGYFRRRAIGIRSGFFKSGLIRNIGFYIAL